MSRYAATHEPVAYVTEYFLGDGVTTNSISPRIRISFLLPKPSIIHELFNEGAIDAARVGKLDGANGISHVGAGGLTMQGGNGIDGETLLTWIDPVEMGGTLLLEATGVTLSPGSTGILAGFFVGMETQPACTAGFQVTAQQGTGAVTVQPMLKAQRIGATYAMNPANQYALRIRVHCPENRAGLRDLSILWR